MQPTAAKKHDSDELADLGRVVAHVVHDLKNQLNGLKLYATFLRNRMERDKRPPDEVETVGKLMAGLDRAAQDLAIIVRYSRPTELRRQPQASLSRILSKAVDENSFTTRDEAGDGGQDDLFYGEFDSEALAGALRTLADYAASASPEQPLSINLRRKSRQTIPGALVEWRAAGSDGANPNFSVLEGIASVRITLATRIIEAHGGRVEHDAGALCVWLPLTR